MLEKHKIKFINIADWEQEFFAHHIAQVKKEEFIKELTKLGFKPKKRKEK